MVKEINALELRKHFGEITDDVHVKKETYIVTKNGRPIMVLLDIDTYHQGATTNADQEGSGTSAKSNPGEESFIEEYSEERIREFLAEDTPEGSGGPSSLKGNL